MLTPVGNVLSFLFGSFTTKYKMRLILYREIVWNLTTLHEVLEEAKKKNLEPGHIEGLLDYRLKFDRYEALKRETPYHYLPEAEDVDLLYKDLDVMRKSLKSFKDPLDRLNHKLFWFGPTFIEKPFQRRIMLKVANTFVRGRMYVADVPDKWPLTWYPLRRVRDKVVGYR